jgi:hypothetical protein
VKTLGKNSNNRNIPKNSKRTRRNPGNAISRYPTLGTFFPERLAISLAYTDELTLSTTNNLPTFGSAIAFRLNSLYDPYFAAGGHQPYGYDQITPFYSRYLVHGCDVECEFSDPAVDGLIVGTFIKNYYDSQSLSGSTINLVSEFPEAWSKALNNTGSQVATYRRYVDIAKQMGLTRAQLDAQWTTCGAITTADPSIPLYFEVAVAAPASPATTTVTVRVRLRFHCIFSARVMVATS